MQTRPNSTKLSNRRNGRFLKRKRDEEGVASTVGTIMALLVFLTFLTLFTNSYVPVWMIDNERSHMNQAMDQFGGIKGKVDDLVVLAQVTGRTDLNMYGPVTLGANGIPVFASPTAGELIYSPYGLGNSSVRLNFTYALPTNPIKRLGVNDMSGGMIQLYAPNRYYVQQWVAYENGAIIVKQLDGQIIRGVPSLDIQKQNVNSRMNVSWTQIALVGVNSTLAGTSTAGVNIDMIYLDSQSYDNSSKVMPVTLTFKTLYRQAWFNYLTTYLSGVTNINNTMSSNPDFLITQDASKNTVTLVLYNVGFFNYNKAIMQMTVNLA
jgi:hypothetical protein